MDSNIDVPAAPKTEFTTEIFPVFLIYRGQLKIHKIDKQSILKRLDLSLEKDLLRKLACRELICGDR